MVTVEEVKTKRDLKKFVDYPNVLYKNVPEFIPAMYGDDLSDWNPKQNPAFEYCEAKCFLARRDGKIVGRIGAIYNKSSNEKWHKNRMRFSQVDFIDDPEVSDALFAAVEAYAREKSCNEIHGPLGFCDLDREGLLVEGFDRRSMFITYYNFPYYKEHLERLGFVKDVDWVENLIQVPQEDNSRVESLRKFGNRALTKYNLRIAEVKSKRDFGPYVVKVFELINIAYSKLYGTVELNDRQIKRYAKKFIPMINPKLVTFIMDLEDNLVGFGIAAPSMANALKKSNGRLFPTGWIGILRSFKKNDTVDLFLIAVHPEYQNTGVNAALLTHVLDGCYDIGIKYAETGPTLETNEKIQTQWKFFDKEQHKRRRCFIKKI